LSITFASSSNIFLFQRLCSSDMKRKTPGPREGVTKATSQQSMPLLYVAVQWMSW
jgi:hypothetical protein